MRHSVVIAALTLVATPLAAARQDAFTRIPLAAEHWEATDSTRFETHHGRPSLYINRGVALARGITLVDGVIEFAMAATSQTNFLGTVFRAQRPDFAEVVFFRVGLSGTSQAVQYGPALNSLGAAWQVYNGPGATAVAELTRERWIPVRIVLAGPMVTIYLHGATEPTLTVPRLAGAGGGRFGIWAGLFGRGAWFSDFRYTLATAPSTVAETPSLPPGTLTDWELSPVLDAETMTPGQLPDLQSMRWERVAPEPTGIVLVNRHRIAPMASVPVDPATRLVNVDSLMGGRVRGSKVVLARTTINADRAMLARLHFGYSDGVVIYANGQPLFFGMNAQFFRGDGILSRGGDAVYLPLRPGPNEIVLAVTEFSGGWAFWGRLDR